VIWHSNCVFTSNLFSISNRQHNLIYFNFQEFSNLFDNFYELSINMKNYFVVRRRTSNRNIVVRLPKTHGKEDHCCAPFIKLTAKINGWCAYLFVTHGKQAHLVKPSRPTTNNQAHHQRERWDRRSREDRTVQIREDNYINTAPTPPNPTPL
jgi:hypothetical protein